MWTSICWNIASTTLINLLQTLLSFHTSLKHKAYRALYRTNWSLVLFKYSFQQFLCLYGDNFTPLTDDQKPLHRNPTQKWIPFISPLCILHALLGKEMLFKNPEPTKPCHKQTYVCLLYQSNPRLKKQVRGTGT